MSRLTTELDVKGVSTYNSMLALDGTKKEFCSGCGGPREVEYAKTHTCFCCGAIGTQKTQPVFDEFGELVPAEVVAAQRAEQAQQRGERLVAANAARRAQAAAPAAKPVAKQPAVKQQAVKAAAIPAKPAAKPAPVQAKPASRKERQAQAAARLAALL